MFEKVIKPVRRPQNPCFSSGPCAKRPGWTKDVIQNALIGRSHRSRPSKERLNSVINKTRDVLGIPGSHRLGIVPASDTGAVEMALWSMVGARGVDLFAWESFGNAWVDDVVNQLKIDDIRVFQTNYGKLPNFGNWDPMRDAIFTWNGTTSGVRVPNALWIPEDRSGLTICDATSAVFAVDIPWSKLDVVTWSWQKVMGGEGAHGMIALSPSAVERLENYQPTWPIPKIFRLTKNGKLIEGIFRGETINTPSMICVEDALDSLAWAERMGGIQMLIARSENNLVAIENWVANTDWVDFLVPNKRERSTTSVCLSIIDPWFQALDKETQLAIPLNIEALLDSEGAAYDINAYRDAPPGLRIWGGSTVESSDLEALFPWLDWAYSTIKHEISG